MQRLPIARSLHLALVGLTLALALVVVLGVSGLYSSPHRYENVLRQSSALATAGANLLSAGIAESAVLLDIHGPGTARLEGQTAAAYNAAAAAARQQAQSDPVSARLVAEQLTAERQARQLAAAGQAARAGAPNGPLTRDWSLAQQLEQRQQQRQADALRRTHASSNRDVILIVVAATLALVAALALITAIVSSMRRPLDALVQATGDLAAGHLAPRVPVSGPRELRDLGTAFNRMAEELSAARRRIEDQRRRLEVTIESLGDALLVTEPHSSTIAAANPRAAELVPELSEGESADAPDSPLPPLEEALRGEIVVEHGGRALAVTASRLGDENAGVVWTLRDTSERARLEQAKSDFVAMASHELRSPLTSIKGFVELLDRSSGGMSERQREFVDIILRSTNRLVELVNDLLDVARIEAGRVEIDRRPIDVGEAVREVAELMGPRLAEKDQQLGMFISPTLPLALADPGRVRQIVANLLTNAHLYTPSGGRIHIGVEGVRAWVQLVVADSGVGLTESERERVFERFYRAPSGHSTPGTGLGLSIVKSLVEMHDGQIEVDSEPGRGTTFRVLLPATTPHPRTGRSLEPIRGRKVLVVDDERDIAELIAGQLAPLEVDARVVTSGQEALALLRSESFDALTLDLLMPGTDGFDVLAEVRADPKLQTLPIVFVSVFSGRHELAGEWTVGKPIDADELRQVLAAAVRSDRTRVLVVAREELQPALEPELDELGIEHEWESSGAAAARICGERRFEVALVDVGIRNPRAALQALDLRGRRLRRAVILFSDGRSATPPGLRSLGMEVVPVDQAAGVLLDTLRGGDQD